MNCVHSNAVGFTVTTIKESKQNSTKQINGKQGGPDVAVLALGGRILFRISWGVINYPEAVLTYFVSKSRQASAVTAPHTD